MPLAAFNNASIVSQKIIFCLETSLISYVNKEINQEIFNALQKFGLWHFTTIHWSKNPQNTNLLNYSAHLFSFCHLITLIKFKIRVFCFITAGFVAFFFTISVCVYGRNVNTEIVNFDARFEDLNRVFHDIVLW